MLARCDLAMILSSLTRSNDYAFIKGIEDALAAIENGVQYLDLNYYLDEDKMRAILEAVKRSDIKSLISFSSSEIPNLRIHTYLNQADELS